MFPGCLAAGIHSHSAPEVRSKVETDHANRVGQAFIFGVVKPVRKKWTDGNFGKCRLNGQKGLSLIDDSNVQDLLSCVRRRVNSFSVSDLRRGENWETAANRYGRNWRMA